LLAIFPVDAPEEAEQAATEALTAATEALATVAALDPHTAGEAPLKMVIALHYGSAIYGNIGAADRLDFTVIGPDVNLVSRIEAVAKSLDLPLLVSDDFARVCGRPLRSLGEHKLRGLERPHELFTVTDPKTA
jgi:adenylate cyclase